MHEGRGLEFDGEDEKILDVAHQPLLGGVGIGDVVEPGLVGHLLDSLHGVREFNQFLRHVSPISSMSCVCEFGFSADGPNFYAKVDIKIHLLVSCCSPFYSGSNVRFTNN